MVLINQYIKSKREILRQDRHATCHIFKITNFSRNANEEAN